MSAERPWKAAVWHAVPGARPTDVKRGTFKTAWAAQAWMRRQTSPGLVKKCWHEATLPPADLTPVKAATPKATAQDALDGAGDWKGLALTAIEALAASGVPFSAYDLVEIQGVPEPKSPAAWGAVFSAARKAGLVRRIGYAPSKRPTVAGSAAAVWVGAA